MRYTRLLVVAILLVPAVAEAQRRGKMGSGEGSDAKWDRIESPTLSGPTLSAKDMESIDPIKLFLDKKKDLKLTEEQLAHFTSLDVQLKEKNSPFLKSVDSLRKELKPKSSTPSAEEEARLVVGQEVLMGTVKSIRANYDASAKEALEKLDDAQKKTAGELLEKNNKEAGEMLREKARGGRGGGAGGMSGGSGRRPPG